jgi:hypothetical protein
MAAAMAAETLMPNTVFFSWQADTPTREGRNFIARALETAVKRLVADTAIESAVRELIVDSDTQNIGGQPPIVETIFRKIDAASVFVPDLTFVGTRRDGRPTPNPNVLIEYGWALKSLTYYLIIPVMNTAFGEPTAETMPFNVAHLRRPICFHCAADLNDGERKAVRDKLAKDLEAAIRTVLRLTSLSSGSLNPLLRRSSWLNSQRMAAGASEPATNRLVWFVSTLDRLVNYDWPTRRFVGSE